MSWTSMYWYRRLSSMTSRCYLETLEQVSCRYNIKKNFSSTILLLHVSVSIMDSCFPECLSYCCSLLIVAKININSSGHSLYISTSNTFILSWWMWRMNWLTVQLKLGSYRNSISRYWHLAHRHSWDSSTSREWTQCHKNIARCLCQ